MMNWNIWKSNINLIYYLDRIHITVKMQQRLYERTTKFVFNQCHRGVGFVINGMHFEEMQFSR